MNFLHPHSIISAGASTFSALPSYCSTSSRCLLYLYSTLCRQMKKEVNRVPRILVRHAATSRRTTKILRTRPAHSTSPSSKYALPTTNHIVFNPPPSAPSPYQTPFLFLPLEDPRRMLLAQSHPFTHSSTHSTNLPSSQTGSTSNPGSSLSPPIRPPRTKTYHLTPHEIAEMRALRASDPWKWTRARLAEKFGCTEFFAGMCAPASAERLDWARQNLERVKQRWGPKRRTAREERGKRREVWGRDE